MPQRRSLPERCSEKSSSMSSWCISARRFNTSGLGLFLISTAWLLPSVLISAHVLVSKWPNLVSISCHFLASNLCHPQGPSQSISWNCHAGFFKSLSSDGACRGFFFDKGLLLGASTLLDFVLPMISQRTPGLNAIKLRALHVGLPLQTVMSRRGNPLWLPSPKSLT